jgi:hypothetical protein
MKTSIPFAFAVAAAAAAGCNAPATLPASPSSLNQAPLRSIHAPRGVPAALRSRRQSWMASDAGNQELLYVSDGTTNDVYAYAYPTLKLEGTLTGFNLPQGECTDANGNVWITNTNAATIVEYAHGGTSPIATLSDPGEYPVGCAVDPTTGNLAVTNIFASSGSQGGSVSIYQGAKGTPTQYADSEIHFYYSDGYDDDGNLFVDGKNTKTFEFNLIELPSGQSTFTNLSIGGGSIYYPGGVRWNGSHLLVGDQEYRGHYDSGLYQLSVSGSTATIVKSIRLEGTCDVVEFSQVVHGQVAAGDDNWCGYGKGMSSVERWNYPAGGTARRAVAGVSGPIGATLSGSGSSPQLSRAEHRGSWMAPDAKKSKLVYISTEFPSSYDDDNVYVYSYPDLVPKGTLTGFDIPAGLCTDKAGDVFVTEIPKQQIVEYAHGGTTPIQVLSDPGYPADCAVDPTTGNLAVTDIDGPGSSAASVEVYEHASGTPTQYRTRWIKHFAFCGYDDAGNLFVDGWHSIAGFGRLAELPSGSSTFTALKPSRRIIYPGGVVWAGSYLAVADATTGIVYHFAIEGDNATKIGFTKLLDINGRATVFDQFALDGDKLVVGNSVSPHLVMLWNYPRGHKPAKYRILPGYQSAFGSAISNAP